AALTADVAAWLPMEIPAVERQSLLDGLVERTLQLIDDAIDYDPNAAAAAAGAAEEGGLEAQEEEGEEHPGRNPASENLLDRLLYKGVLPRYAFPTDVATFHVFDPERSTLFRPTFRFTPSQGLPVALSQYAPGKEVWIGSKLWTSGAVYSPMQSDRYQAWLGRRFYYECKYCH